MNLRKAFTRNLRSEKGSISVEAILMFPMLAWAFMAMFVFFEGLRESNITLKSTYTVADLLSRESDPDNPLTVADLEGMNAIYAWLTRSSEPVQIRVTVIRYDEPSDTHLVMWSHGVNGASDLEQEEIAGAITPHVPIMANATNAIVVETWGSYKPVIDMGLTETDLYNIVVTSPRFAGQLVLEGVGDGGGSAHDDNTDENNTL
jgi:hypothetical protein